MQIYAGSTALQTAITNQAIVASGMTETVRLAIHQCSSVTVATLDRTTPNRYSLGVTDGTTQRSIALVSENGAAAALTDAGGRYDVDTCILNTNPAANTRDSEATHVSFGAGTHTVSITDAPASAFIDGHIFFGGTDVARAIVDFTGNATQNSNAAVTGLSFAPTMAIVFGRGSAAFAADTAWANKSFILGYAVKTPTGAIEQFCWGDAQGNSSTNCRSVFRSNRCAARMTAAAAQGSLELVSWNSDGATFKTRDASDAVSVVIAFLKIPNALRAVSSLLDTSADGEKAITGIGFKPKAYICIASRMAALDSSATDATTAKWSHGCRDQGGKSQLIGSQSEDGASTGNTRSIAQFYDDDAAIAYIIDDDGSDHWFAQHISMDSDGFTVDVFTEVGAVDNAVGFLVIGPDPIFDETEQISDGVVFHIDQAKAVAETEEISDAAVLAGAATIVADDTEQITDDAVVLASALVDTSETEEISDECVLVSVSSGFSNSVVLDTEEVSDDCVLVVSRIVCDESEEITDECVLVVHKIICDETEEISDECQLVGAATIVASETEEIIDQALLVTGRLLVVDETEEITDTVVFVERRLRSGGWRGTSLQGGAVAGDVLSAGSARGKSFGG